MCDDNDDDNDGNDDNDYTPHTLLTTIKEALQEKKMLFGECEHRPLICTFFTGPNGIFPIVIDVGRRDPLVAVFSHLQCRAPVEKRQAVAEFIARANYGLRVGSFELDFSDGEIRYRTSIYLADATLTNEMFHQLFWANISTADRYLPGFMSVLWNDVAPEDAIAMVEAD